MIIDDYLDYSKTYKEKYGAKCIILMQVGSFYEMYSVRDDTSEDIYAVADICNIQISRKNKSILDVSHHNPLMAGFPLATLRKFTNILLNNNYTIVLVEQVTEPPNPERKITEILSPGMNINVATKKSNYMMVIYYEFADDLPIVGIAGIDLSTGASFVYEGGATKSDPEFINDEVFRLLTTYNPCEVVILSDKKYDDCKKAYLTRGLNLSTVLTHLKWETYEYIKSMSKVSYQNAILEKAFSDKKSPGMLSVTESLNLEKYNVGRIALCCLLQFSYEHNADIIQQLNVPEIINDQKHLTIEYNSAVQLNVLGLYPNDKPLIDILNRCQTAFGSRLFKSRLLKPVIDPDVLNKRYDAIAYLLEDQRYQKVSKHLGHILDIERIKRKIMMGKFHPQDWYGFNVSLENAIDVLTFLNYSGQEMCMYKDLIDYYTNIIDINEASKYNINEIKGNIFLAGVYQELDDYATGFQQAYKKIVHLAEKINGLVPGSDATLCKLEYTEKDGHFITMTSKRYETAKARDPKFMQQFQKKTGGGHGAGSTSVKLVSEDIIAASATMDDKQSMLSKMATTCYQTFLQEFIHKYSHTLDNLVKTIADIDIACCNARNAYEFRYYRPNIVQGSEPFIDAKNIRHPIIERIDDSTEYVGNDILLANQGLCLYGINSAGKSSLMKSVGLNIIMAQAGMYVAATAMDYYPYKHIFTRISGMDNIYKGMSSFIVEMTELRNILQRCDKYSLVLGDEICSGTEATSALAIVAAGINTLVSKRTAFIFATHLHQLPDIDIVKMHTGKHITIKHIHITIDDKNRIVYERKLRDGTGLSTYGIEVCKSLDMPTDFMKVAEGVRKQIEGYSNLLVSPDTSKYNKDVYMTECCICGAAAVDTHHIKYQCQSDEDGYFTHHHQNIRHNLMPLCKTCHQMEHSGQINIKGYIKTSDGVVPLVQNTQQSRILPPQSANLSLQTLEEEQITKLCEFVRRGKCHWYLRSAKTKTYKKCSDTSKILEKVNKLLAPSSVTSLDHIMNDLYDPSL
jgi:DNA mismatch repair protein MutS